MSAFQYACRLLGGCGGAATNSSYLACVRAQCDGDRSGRGFLFAAGSVFLDAERNNSMTLLVTSPSGRHWASDGGANSGTRLDDMALDLTLEATGAIQWDRYATKRNQRDFDTTQRNATSGDWGNARRRNLDTTGRKSDRRNRTLMTQLGGNHLGTRRLTQPLDWDLGRKPTRHNS